MDKFLTKKSEDTENLGFKFAKTLKAGQTVFLYGELGAGKTTFAKGVAEGLGVRDRIISPTFVLHRIHKAKFGKIKRLNHVDLYRIEDQASVENLGLSEAFDEKNSINLVEWPEKLNNFPKDADYKIYFKKTGENSREILIHKGGFYQIKNAIGVLKRGGIVIYPTDTAFGIGCRIDNEESVKRLFKIRKRPENKATPVLFDSIDRVEEYVLPFDSKVKKLMEKHWPGALTIILPCKASKVSRLVRGGGKTLGVRIPDHIIPIQLIKSLGVPIIGTSANFSGDPTPFSFEKLDKRLIKLVDLCLEDKTKEGSLASTVVDCSVTPWKILRQGSVVI